MTDAGNNAMPQTIPSERMTNLLAMSLGVLIAVFMVAIAVAIITAIRRDRRRRPRPMRFRFSLAAALWGMLLLTLSFAALNWLGVDVRRAGPGGIALYLGLVVNAGLVILLAIVDLAGLWSGGTSYSRRGSGRDEEDF